MSVDPEIDPKLNNNDIPAILAGIMVAFVLFILLLTISLTQ